MPFRSRVIPTTRWTIAQYVHLLACCGHPNPAGLARAPVMASLSVDRAVVASELEDQFRCIHRVTSVSPVRRITKGHRPTVFEPNKWAVHPVHILLWVNAHECNGLALTRALMNRREMRTAHTHKERRYARF